MILGVGVDTVSVRRIREAIDRSGERFTRRVFSDAERAYCDGQAAPAEHYAARFAAKEALFKSIPDYPRTTVPWREAEIVRSDSGRPAFRIPAARAADLGMDFHVSLSHTDETATAVVISEPSGAGRNQS